MKKPDTVSSTELFNELAISSRSFNATAPHGKFEGTDNPRHLRVVSALWVRPRKREEIDRIAGASNGPEIIAELRRRGLDVPCQRTPAIDRDGYPIRFGVYEFDNDDRRKLRTWMRLRNAKGRA